MTRALFPVVFVLGLFGCNTAQVTEAPMEQDAGAACVTNVSIPQCDAGGVVMGCVAEPDSGFAAARGLPAGETVPYGCLVHKSEIVEVPTVQCTIFSECRCDAPEAGVDEGGADGGSAPHGVWTCSTQR